MWRRTRPYKTVALLVVLALSQPAQTVAISYVTQTIANDATNAPLWLYFTPLLVTGFDRFMTWQFEEAVPLSGPKYHLRCFLLTQRLRLAARSTLAQKWSSPGRFLGLLNDLDELVNGVWGSCLNVMELLVSVIWIVVMCLVVVGASFFQDDEEDSYSTNFGVYVSLFIGVAVVALIMPFVWFRFFAKKLLECDNMTEDAEALFLSASGNAILASNTTQLEHGNARDSGKSQITVDQEAMKRKTELQFLGAAPPDPDGTLVAKDSRVHIYGDHQDIETGDPKVSQDLLEKGKYAENNRLRHSDTATISLGGLNSVANKAFKVFLLSSFRSFSFQLTMTTNFSLLSEIYGPLCAYFVLTARGFGEDTAITLVILLSMRDFANISSSLLTLLIDMNKGCIVLKEVVELLNSDSLPDEKNTESVSY